MVWKIPREELGSVLAKTDDLYCALLLLVLTDVVASKSGGIICVNG